jgi:hypothetical protein
MGRRQVSDSLAVKNRQVLEAQLAADRHNAEAAREVLPELDHKIDIAKLRVERIREREPDFLRPAILEIADAAGLGDRYLKAVAELGNVLAELRGASDAAGRPYGVDKIELPRFALPSLDGKKVIIAADSSRIPAWNGLAAALRDDPRCDVRKALSS